MCIHFYYNIGVFKLHLSFLEKKFKSFFWIYKKWKWINLQSAIHNSQFNSITNIIWIINRYIMIVYIISLNKHDISSFQIEKDHTSYNRRNSTKNKFFKDWFIVNSIWSILPHRVFFYVFFHVNSPLSIHCEGLWPCGALFLTLSGTP